MPGELFNENIPNESGDKNPFLRNLDRIIELNLANESFGVGELAEAANLSRMQLYRKVRKLSGRNVSQYIREIRLTHALEMLKKGEETVSEIAYLTGFGSASYFSSCFKNFYGYPPGQVKNGSLDEENESGEELTPVHNEVRRRRFPLLASGVLILVLLISGGYLAFRSISGKDLKDSAAKINSDRQKSIAVLPFINDSPDNENEYFCNGMMKDVLNKLQKITHLKVKASSDIEEYRQSDLNVSNIADELGVAYILQGSTRKDKNQFRITMHLIDGLSGNLVWSETYDGSYSDTIWEVQSDIASKVAHSLDVLITPVEAARLNEKPTAEISAYDLVIKADYELKKFWQDHKPEYLDIANKLVDIALQNDSAYLDALSLKGYLFMAAYNFDSAIYFSDKILTIDSEFDQAYAIKGECLQQLGNFDQSIDNLLKAIQYASDDDDIGWWNYLIGETYSTKGEFIYGLPYYIKAIEYAQGGKLQEIYTNIGLDYMDIGYYEKAEKYFLKALDQKQGNLRSTFFLYNWCLEVQGKYEELILFSQTYIQQGNFEDIGYECIFRIYTYLKEFDKAKEYYFKIDLSKRLTIITEQFFRNRLAFFHNEVGNLVEAERIFTEQINELSTGAEGGIRFQNLMLAEIYAYKGDRDKAIKNLNEYARGGWRWGWQDFAMIDPLFANLREDPEFLNLVRKAQDEKATIRTKVMEMEANGQLNL